ncbi:helix-hairpin-helix domain-containing protein [Nostoc sp.]|uniref:helix-hairpin-helix domain-containing protein n=1 Tax=Nostoc sp. TaxID=1180 RepID=UPI002FF4CA45
MTVLTCASTGKSITLLGEPIANSGEGKVWRTNHNGYLAKIYHSQTPERVQKLAVMIAHRPKEPNSHLNHISFAWPKSVLKDAQGDCVGFLMPEIKEAKELIDVYNPSKRKGLKLDVDWRFLHTTALNIASIIEAIHISGYVLGDIKQQNILVNDRALPSIIDTDSFQVRNPVNGKIYRCPVGSPDYTPPELIDKDFSTIDQTEVHDRFRLAVIIYQLLFGGQTLFTGKWIGAGVIPETNELIRQGLWLYAPNSLIQPVDRTIPLEIVHPEVQRCFLRCFNDGYKNSNLRPTAGDWVKALRLAVNELTICGKLDSHYYSRTYGKCYWCDRSTKLGTDIFPGFVRPKQAAVLESTSEPKAFAADKIIEIVQQSGQQISVIGRVINTLTKIHFDQSSFKKLVISVGDNTGVIKGYLPFRIVIFDEGFKKLSQAVGRSSIYDLIQWFNSLDYIEITGFVEVVNNSGGITPQIILKDPKQLRVITQNEANKLLGLSITTFTSSVVKQTQSQFS